ncbi:hypothetical protein HAX54_004729 [Datura stramonium]|uniref:Uncharacterized protein n=1 Tax=Datura stramonium TaxID=4076 RepID=A0ABS8T7F4_DATST|nr:hypothetical protein [Datura stramonium]
MVQRFNFRGSLTSDGSGMPQRGVTWVKITHPCQQVIFFCSDHVVSIENCAYCAKQLISVMLCWSCSDPV